MRTALICVATALVLVTAPAPSAAQASATDEGQIRAIVEDQVTSWNAGDAIGFSKSFGDSGSFTNIRGTAFYGHKAFEDRHREIFTGFFKGSKLAMSITR